MPATPDQIPTDLALEIGENLSPDRFMAAARAFFGYVQEISSVVAPEGEPRPNEGDEVERGEVTHGGCAPRG